MVVEKSINMLKNLKNKIIKLYLFNIKKLTILALIFFGFIIVRPSMQKIHLMLN